MKRSLSLIISLFLILVFVSFATAQINSKSTAAKLIKKKSDERRKKEPEFSCQRSAGVVALELSQMEIAVSCSIVDETCSNNSIIKVEVVTIGIERQKYVYTVSGGKIVGEGANIEWDLSDAKPGKYTITAGISQPIFDGERWEVLGPTKTKFIVIKE